MYLIKTISTQHRFGRILAARLQEYYIAKRLDELTKMHPGTPIWVEDDQGNHIRIDEGMGGMPSVGILRRGYHKFVC